MINIILIIYGISLVSILSIIKSGAEFEKETIEDLNKDLKLIKYRSIKNV